MYMITFDIERDELEQALQGLEFYRVALNREISKDSLTAQRRDELSREIERVQRFHAETSKEYQRVANSPSSTLTIRLRDSTRLVLQYARVVALSRQRRNLKEAIEKQQDLSTFEQSQEGLRAVQESLELLQRQLKPHGWPPRERLKMTLEEILDLTTDLDC